MARRLLGFKKEPLPVPVSDVAIVVIAVAVTAQTLMMAVALIAGVRAWRRVRAEVQQMQASLDRQLQSVSARIDEAVVDARIALRAVENLATRANGLMQDAVNTANSVRTAVTVPRALLLTGAASAARWLLSKWRLASPKLRGNEGVPRRQRPVGHVERLGGAEIF